MTGIIEYSRDNDSGGNSEVMGIRMFREISIQYPDELGIEIGGVHTSKLSKQEEIEIEDIGFNIQVLDRGSKTRQSPGRVGIVTPVLQDLRLVGLETKGRTVDQDESLSLKLSRVTNQ